jgi:hypothetical protein
MALACFDMQSLLCVTVSACDAVVLLHTNTQHTPLHTYDSIWCAPWCVRFGVFHHGRRSLLLQASHQGEGVRAPAVRSKMTEARIRVCERAKAQRDIQLPGRKQSTLRCFRAWGFPKRTRDVRWINVQAMWRRHSSVCWLVLREESDSPAGALRGIMRRGEDAYFHCNVPVL